MSVYKVTLERRLHLMRTMYVEAPSEESAEEIAWDNTALEDFDMIESDCEEFAFIEEYEHGFPMMEIYENDEEVM